MSVSSRLCWLWKELTRPRSLRTSLPARGNRRGIAILVVVTSLMMITVGAFDAQTFHRGSMCVYGHMCVISSVMSRDITKHITVETFWALLILVRKVRWCLGVGYYIWPFFRMAL